MLIVLIDCFAGPLVGCCITALLNTFSVFSDAESSDYRVSSICVSLVHSYRQDDKSRGNSLDFIVFLRTLSRAQSTYYNLLCTRLSDETAEGCSFGRLEEYEHGCGPKSSEPNCQMKMLIIQKKKFTFQLSFYY